MALLNIGDDPWLLEYESCEKLYHDIMEQLSSRQREIRTSEKYSQLSAAVRIRLKQYNNEVTQLQQKLSLSTVITDDELERRTRQVETLQSKAIQMQRLFDNHKNRLNQDRSALLNEPGVSHWGNDDVDAIRIDPTQLSDNELRIQQKKMLGEQEEGLENLSKIISRQKDIAQTINKEVDLHNDILDDLGDHMDRTDLRVKNETTHITVIDRKDKTCVYWVIIILLFISIIVVVSV